MAKTLDFNKVKKNYFTVILNDEQQTKLSVMTPTKRMMEELVAFGSQLDNVSDDEELNTLYDFASRILSRNKQNIILDGGQLSELLDYEDLILLFEGYTDFITELRNEKN